MTVIDSIGWLGAAALLIAYLLLSKGRLNASSRLYHSLNLLGGVGLGINTYMNHSYPATLVNIIWTTIAVYSLIRLFREVSS